MHRYTDGYNDALLRFKSMVHSAKTVESRVLIREKKATDETFETVVNKAADKLEIDITGAYQLDRVEKEEKRHSYEDLDI